MLSPCDVIDFLNTLDMIDQVKIEENQNGMDVTLDDIKSFNSGNNCLHHILVLNNHRIVIQTYKDIERKGDLDIIQGKPEFESLFEDMTNIINARPQDYTDDRLNKLFVLYCGLWSKWVTSFYWHSQKMNSFILEFGSDMSLCWASEHWLINVDDVWPEQIQRILDFIDAVEDICR